MYNLVSKLSGEVTGDTKEKLDGLKKAVETLERDLHLMSFTSRNKRRTNGEGEDKNQLSKRLKTNEGTGGAAGELEAYGYQVVPESIEDNAGGLWEPLIKVR